MTNTPLGIHRLGLSMTDDMSFLGNLGWQWGLLSSEQGKQ